MKQDRAGDDKSDQGEAEILTVRPSKEWTYKGSAYIVGDVVSSRLDVRALGLAPLRIQQVWIWDPEEEYWAEPGDPIPRWARPIIAAGKRPTFEMEQVIPGAALQK